MAEMTKSQSFLALYERFYMCEKLQLKIQHLIYCLMVVYHFSIYKKKSTALVCIPLYLHSI